MFYKLNKLSGRLVGTQQLKAMLPQGLRPFAEPQPIVYDPSFKAVETPLQVMKKPGSYHFGSVPEKLQKKMIQFQKDDGVPVHFKGGSNDYLLFGVTCFIIGVGLFESFRFYYESSFPNKGKE